MTATRQQLSDSLERISSLEHELDEQKRTNEAIVSENTTLNQRCAQVRSRDCGGRGSRREYTLV